MLWALFWVCLAAGWTCAVWGPAGPVPFSFLHPFNKSLLSTYYVPSQVLGVGDTDEVLNGPLNSNCAPSRRERYKGTGPGITGRQSHKLCSKRGSAKPNCKTSRAIPAVTRHTARPTPSSCPIPGPAPAPRAPQVSARVPGPFPQTQRLSPGYQEGTKRGLEGPAHLSLAHEANKS